MGRAVKLAVGAGVVAAAGIIAVYLWPARREVPHAEPKGPVEVWGGKPSQIESIELDSSSAKVRLDPRHDDRGRWYVVTVKKPNYVPPPKKPTSVWGPRPPESVRRHNIVRFVSVKRANEVAAALAPLVASRSLGNVAGSEAGFGLDKPEGTLRVTLGGQERAVVIGSRASDGGRYVRVAATGKAYVVQDEFVEDLLSPEKRLPDKDLHAFDSKQIDRVELLRGDRKVQLTRSADGAWSLGSSPDGGSRTTASAWMQQLGKLRSLGKETKDQSAKDVLEVKYYDHDKPVGDLRLLEDIPILGIYYARTEFTRWYVQVQPDIAKQVVDKADALLK